MKPLPLLIALSWVGLWWSPDQDGQRLFDREQYAEAAEAFENSFHKGVALYRAGSFKEALRVFSLSSTPEAYYNRGNCQVLLGQYAAAVESYGYALKSRPHWQEAIENRQIASIRAERMDTKGGAFGDQQIGADEIVFDRTGSSNEGQDTEIKEEKAVSDSNVQALWLRRVQTKPADFLKMKFAYQVSTEDTQP